MVKIQTARASNAELHTLGPGLVAVFVGATSGIGETTAREFIRSSKQPRVYLVGRNATQAANLSKEFKALNADAKISTICDDVSLLKNVDKICDEIKAKERKINLLCLTQGMMTSQGRDDWSKYEIHDSNRGLTLSRDGLDKKFSLHYYSRMRFISNLLPLLKSASQEPPQLSRVVNVFNAGSEARINMDDLSLKTKYSLKACADHATTMTSLVLNALSTKNPDVSFVHTAPGGVNTNLARNMNMFAKAAMDVIVRLPLPVMLSAKESGERHLYVATSKEFENKGAAHLIGYSGDQTGNEKLLKEYEEKKIPRWYGSTH